MKGKPIENDDGFGRSISRGSCENTVFVNPNQTFCSCGYSKRKQYDNDCTDDGEKFGDDESSFRLGHVSAADTMVNKQKYSSL